MLGNEIPYQLAPHTVDRQRYWTSAFPFRKTRLPEWDGKGEKHSENEITETSP